MPLKPGSAKRPVNAAVGGDGRIADNGDIFCCCMHAHTRVCESQCVSKRVCAYVSVCVCVCASERVYCCFYVDTARDVVTVLHMFLNTLSLYLHIFRHTHTSTHTQAHMYDQHTRGMATTRHRSLVGRGWRKTVVRDKAQHTKKIRKPVISNLKNIFWTHKACSKATRLFVTEW